MKFLKNNLLKICIVLITILLAGMCIYAILNYSNNKSNTSYRSTFNGNNSLKIESAVPDTHIFKNKSADNSHYNLNTSNNNYNDRSRNENFRGSPPGNGPSNFNGRNMMNENRNNNSNIKYSPIFIAYLVIFFILLISICLIFKRKFIKLSNSDIYTIIICLFISGFLLRIYLGLLIDGQPFDIGLYKRWATNAANNLLGVYQNNSSIDYPPVYIYVLSLIGKLANISIFNNYYYLLLKLPSIITDILSGYFIFKIAHKHISKEFSVLLSAFYIFNPAVLFNSSIWGQSDSVFAFVVIIAVFLLSEGKLVFSSIAFTILILMKPQGIVLLPLLLFELLKRRNLKSILQCFIPALITGFIIILPFSINNGNINWIFNLYTSTINEYPYASVNAFNFFTLIGANMVKDTTTLFVLNYHTFGMIFIVIITLISGFVYFRINSKCSPFISGLILVTGVFNFSVGMHERYMFAAIIIGILCYIYIKDIKLIVLSSLLTLIVYINTHSVFFNTVNGSDKSAYNPLTIIVSLINVITFLYLVKFSINYIKADSKVKSI